MLWLTLTVPLWFFLLAVLVGLVVTFFFRATGMLLLSFIFYFFTGWNVWDWIPVLYWIAVIVAIIAIVIGLVSGGMRLLALVAAGFALLLALVCANSNIFGTASPGDAVVNGITGRQAQLQAELDSEELARKTGDAKLQRQVNHLRRRVVQLHGAVEDLKWQVRHPGSYHGK